MDIVAKNSIDAQPVFSSPEKWLAHYHAETAAGRRAWPPWSRDELLLADREGLIDLHPEWIPGKQGLRMLDLPPFFGRRLPEFGPRFRERFLCTVHAVPEFQSAIRQLIGA